MATPVIISGVSYPLPDEDTDQKVDQYNAALQALAASESGAGTAFPTSPAPATNDRFFRTDRSIEYFYNGTRWLSTQLFTDALPRGDAGPLPYSATSISAERLLCPYAGTYDLWMIEFQFGFFITGGSALSASHKWVTTLVKSTASPVQTTIATATIDSGAIDDWRTSVVAIGALLGTTHLVFEVMHTKTGTPGNIYALPRIIYRLVG